jgi:hypothetical protein
METAIFTALSGTMEGSIVGFSAVLCPFQPQIQNYEIGCYGFMLNLGDSCMHHFSIVSFNFQPLAFSRYNRTSKIHYLDACRSLCFLTRQFKQSFVQSFGQLRVPDKNEKLIARLSHNLIVSVLSFPLHRTNQLDCDYGIELKIQSIFYVYSRVPAKNYKATGN